MLTKKRKGDGLIEVIVATAIFATLLLSLLTIANFTRIQGEESSYALNAIVHARNIAQGIQDEFESATRMQAGPVNPQNITSIAFKKSFNLTSINDLWAQYSISGNNLNRNGISLTSSFVDSMTPIDSNNNYFKMSFYAIDGTTLASSLGEGITAVPDVNDKATTYWRMTNIFALKGYPFVASALREATPLYDNPTVTFPYASPYSFNQAMDTSKYGSWSSDFVSSTPPINAVSNYMGVPYKDPSQIINVHPIIGGIAGQLYDPLHSAGIAGRDVYCFLSSTTFIHAVTDGNGNFTFMGVILSPYTIKFKGDDTYVPCEITQ